MKTALVTGASRGIGAAIAQRLAEAGYAVCINYIERQDLAEALVEKLRAAGFTAMAYRADVADRAQVDAMVEQVRSQLGQIELLVNNAGIVSQQLFQDIDPATWQRSFDVNIGGCFNCSQAVVGDMLRAHKGCIINISSIWGSHGASCEVCYSCTKHAIVGLTRSLSAELAPSGIRVNCVAPGVIDTDMSRSLSRETIDMLKEEIPLHRMGTPREIAEAVLYLAQAEYTTGQVLTVDGGFII